METSKRRRSLRLQALEADRDDDGENSTSDHSDDDASSKRKRKAKSESAPIRSSSQSSERRRTRSNSESTSKRRKQTAESKSELSVATHTEDSTMSTTNRRQTRSLSNQIKSQSKTVTPSPVSTTAATKFSFASPTKTTKKADDYYGSDEESCEEIPSGVINLYRDEEDEVDMSEAASKSPANRRARTRRGRKQHQLQQQLEDWAHRHERPRTLTTGGVTVFDSSTKESLTVDYIRTYGEDYRKYLFGTEGLVNIDFVAYGRPSVMALKTGNHSSNKRSKNNPLGSPESRRSTSSSSSSTTSTSKVTPDYPRYSSHEPWMGLDSLEDHIDPDPHQAPENSRKMMCQPQLTPKMRCILVDWLIELSEHFEFAPETLHFAVTLVDKVLASGFCLPDAKPSNWSTGRRRQRYRTLEELKDAPDYSDSDSYSDDDDESEDSRNYLIPRDRFQLLGVTCVWLACKIKERAPPKAREIAYVSDHIYSTEQITRMERRVCNALKFRFLQARTPHEFLFEFMRASFAGLEPLEEDQKLPEKNLPAAAIGVGVACDSVFRDMANYLLELGRLPYGPTSNAPSLLAAAAIYLARVTLGIPRALRDADDSLGMSSVYYWTPTLEHYTGYDREALKQTVIEIHKYHAAAESSSLRSVFNKYKSKKYNRVALKTVVRYEDLGFSVI